MGIIFSELPLDVQNEVKNSLRVYNICTVYFERGSYRVTSSTVVRKTYAEDYKVIGICNAEDIYSPEERILNYVEEFHSYPVEYKGKRDYHFVGNLNHGDKVCYDAYGNIVKA